MFDSFARLLAILAIVLLVVPACTNAPAAGDAETGTPILVRVVDTGGNAVNGQAVAQIGGTGTWKAIMPLAVGEYEFIIPEGESEYGVYVSCPSGLQASSAKIAGFQLTTEEATEVLATCTRSLSGSTSTIEGIYDASAVGGDRVSLFTGLDEFQGPAATPTGAFGALVTTVGADTTLVATAQDASGNTLAIKALRGLDTSVPVTANVTFSTSDLIDPVNVPDFSSSVPAGHTPGVGLAVVVEPGVEVATSAVQTASSTTLRAFPNLQPGDTHVLYATATASGAPTTAVSTVVVRDELSGVSLDLPTLGPVVPSVVPTALPTFTGLAPLGGSPAFRGHGLVLGWNGIPSHEPFPNLDGYALIRVFLSDGWLGGATSYSMPDLTAFSGFLGAKPLPGDVATWFSIATASTMSTQELVSSQAYPRGWESGQYGIYPPPVVEDSVSKFVLVYEDFVVP